MRDRERGIRYYDSRVDGWGHADDQAKLFQRRLKLGLQHILIGNSRE